MILGAPFESTERSVSRIVLHEGYNAVKMRNDIALIKLDVKIKAHTS